MAEEIIVADKRNKSQKSGARIINYKGVQFRCRQERGII